jgi:hypothetical protein
MQICSPDRWHLLRVPHPRRTGCRSEASCWSRQMEVGWHSSVVVVEDGKEEDSDRKPFFDELEPAVRPGGAGLDQQWGSQTGGRSCSPNSDSASTNSTLPRSVSSSVNNESINQCSIYYLFVVISCRLPRQIMFPQMI